MLVNLNGIMTPNKKASISVKDHGMLYGYGLFVTVRAYQGHLFLIDDHLERLNAGLKLLGIALPGGCRRLEKEMLKTLKANNITNGLVRLTVTAGDSGWSLPQAEYTNPNFIVFAAKPKQAVRDNPKTIAVLQTPYHPYKLEFKGLSRLNYLLGKKELWGRKANEGIFITSDKMVAEGITSNIFMIRDGVILTPPLTIGVHPGTTRQFVVKLARRIGHSIREVPFTLQELGKADEVFLTNASHEISPVIRLEDTIYKAAPGPVTTNLIQEYRSFTRSLRSIKHLAPV